MSSLRLVPPVGGPIEIAGERTLLGRDPSADLVVNDPSVSRRHALIERRTEGWVVLDQRSANGTFLNNQRVEQAAAAVGASSCAWARSPSRSGCPARPVATAERLAASLRDPGQAAPAGRAARLRAAHVPAPPGQPTRAPPAAPPA